VNLTLCSLQAVSVVEYVPWNLYSLDVDRVPPCVFLALAQRLVHFVQWLEAPLPLLDADDDRQLASRSLMLCDWKMDQFGVTNDLDIKLLDTDSLQWYHSLLPLNAESKCKSGPLRLRRSCAGGHECLQHSVRIFGTAPAEFWCNNQTNFCDGFDSPSNVYGLAQTVLQPLFNECDGNFEPDIRRRIRATLTRMTAYQKDDRPTVAELATLFAGFVDEAGGEQCVRQFRRRDGIQSAMTKRAQYNTLNARDRFNTTALAESSSSSSTAKEDDDEDETEQSETEDNHDKDERREMKEARRKNKNKKQ
jgi:hypothetical protein